MVAPPGGGAPIHSLRVIIAYPRHAAYLTCIPTPDRVTYLSQPNGRGNMLSLTYEPQAITANQLNEAVEFYQVFEVESGGLVRLYNDYAPDVYEDPENDLVIDNHSWEFFSYGYTQQYAYSGPVMHDSEMLRGSLAEDILATPGVYVPVAYPCADTGDECENWTHYEGWVVLKKTD